MADNNINQKDIELYQSLQSTLDQLGKSVSTLCTQISSNLVPTIKNASINLSSITKEMNALKTKSKEANEKGLGEVITSFLNIAKNATDARKTLNDFAKMFVTITDNTSKKSETLVDDFMNITSSFKDLVPSIFTPMGLAITAATVCFVGLVAACSEWSDGTETRVQQLQRENEEIKSQITQVEELTNAYLEDRRKREKEVKESLNEIDYYQQLYRELQGIVDENGKVKEGYEDRAEVITTILKDAFGVEINLIDGSIEKYDELKGTIDEVISKQRSLAILDANKDAYQEAIKNINKTRDLMDKASDDIIRTQQEIEIAKQELIDRPYSMYDSERDEMGKRLEELIKNNQLYQDEFDKQSALYDGYTSDIAAYYYNLEQNQNGNYENMVASTYDYNQRMRELKEEDLANIEAGIEQEKIYLEDLKTNQNSYNEEEYAAEKKKYQDNIEMLQLNRIQKIFEIELTTTEEKQAWLDGVAEQISGLSGEQYQFKQISGGFIQMYRNGIAEEQPFAEKDMYAFAVNQASTISKQKGGTQEAGVELVNGVKEGLGDSLAQYNAIQESISFASGLVRAVKRVFDIRSPSKVMKEIGGYVVEGLQVGIEDEELSTLQQAKQFGENIINTMQDELNQSLDIPEVNKRILTDVVTDFSTSRYHNQTQSDLATLTGLLSKYLPYIADNSAKEIVLNDNTIVGKLAPKMDVALAGISRKKGRGL